MLVRFASAEPQRELLLDFLLSTNFPEWDLSGQGCQICQIALQLDSTPSPGLASACFLILTWPLPLAEDSEAQVGCRLQAVGSYTVNARWSHRSGSGSRVKTLRGVRVQVKADPGSRAVATRELTLDAGTQRVSPHYTGGGSKGCVPVSQGRTWLAHVAPACK